MCSEVLFWMNQFALIWALARQPIKCNLLARKLPRGILLVWVTWVWCFPVEQQVVLVWVHGWGVGGLGVVVTKPHSTVSCHQCSAAMHVLETGSWSTDLTFFCLWSRKKVSGEVVLMNNNSVDRRMLMPPWGHRPFCQTPHRWKNFRWFCK